MWRKSSYSPSSGSCVEIDWRKSSYSTGGNGSCIEMGEWHKSSHSGNQGNCVEAGNFGVILVRDTKDRTGPMLTFTRGDWVLFLGAIDAFG